MTTALVAGAAGLGGAVVNGFVASRLQRDQSANAKELEDHKRDIAERLATQQREHDGKLSVLQSELRGVEDEARQLRAHSLGLEVERRRNFEAKRAELCASLFAAVAKTANGAGLLEQLKMRVPEAHRAAVAGPPSPSFEELRAVIVQAFEDIAKLSLYLSDATYGELVAQVAALDELLAWR